jgi:formyl-CoA transferase
VSHPTRGEVDVLRPPLTFSDTPATVRSGVPADGEHTRVVLKELGYSDDEIATLHTSGAVGIREGRRTP